MIFLITKNNSLLVHNCLQSTKSPHFPLRGKFGQLTVVRGRECLVGLSILLVYAWKR